MSWILSNRGWRIPSIDRISISTTINRKRNRPAMMKNIFILASSLSSWERKTQLRYSHALVHILSKDERSVGKHHGCPIWKIVLLCLAAVSTSLKTWISLVDRQPGVEDRPCVVTYDPSYIAVLNNKAQLNREPSGANEVRAPAVSDNIGQGVNAIGLKS